MFLEKKLRIDLAIAILVILGLVFALGIVILKGVALSAPWHVFGLLFPNFILLGILLFAAFGPGSLALRVIKFNDTLRPEFFLYSISLGFGILAHLTLLTGALKLFYSPVVWILLSGCGLLSLFEIYHHRTEYSPALKRLTVPRYLSWFSFMLITILILTWGYSLFSTALLPPFTSDEVAYHLAIPKIYIQNHAITYIPFIPYANWPLETEMLFTLSLLIPSEILAHLIEWSAMILVCIGIYLFGRKYFYAQVGLVAAVLFAATPMVTTLAGSGLIELSLTLYSFLCVITLFNWLASGENFYWILSAVFGGLAASTKLNAAMIPLLLGIFMIIASLAYKKMPYQRAVKQFVLYGVIAFAVVIPWYIKSWIFTGNPIWPFLYPIFGGRNWDALGNSYLLGFIQKPNLQISVGNWLSGLWYLSDQPLLFGPYNVRLGWSYLILLPLVIPASFFIRSDKRLHLQWLVLLGVLLYTSWFFQTQQSRFLMPVIPILALLAAIGISWLWSLKEKYWKFLIQISLVAGFLLSSWFLNPADRILLKSRWPYLTGKISRDSFLETQIPGYQTIVYANQKLPENADIWLGLFEPRGYYLDRNYMWANPISQRYLRLEEYQNPDQLTAELHKLGFTHLIFRMTNLERYGFISYGEEYTQLITSMLASPHVHLLFQSADLKLYELLP